MSRISDEDTMTTATAVPTCRAILLDLLTRLDREASKLEEVGLIDLGFSVLDALKALNVETNGPEPSNAERAWWRGFTRED
jgi:hypothetical protein